MYQYTSIFFRLGRLVTLLLILKTWRDNNSVFVSATSVDFPIVHSTTIAQPHLLQDHLITPKHIYRYYNIKYAYGLFSRSNTLGVVPGNRMFA